MNSKHQADTHVVNKTQEWRDVFTTSKDGLKLYARDYGSRISPLTPVVCLPGLTRNSKDFHELAIHLSEKRRVLCLDYRGRGRSDYDPDYKNYSPLIEVSDTLDVMTAMGINHAIIVGTSRGGILAMIMAVVRPTALKGVILNDIGPAINVEGLLRISGYIGNMPKPKNWAQAVIMIKKAAQAHFPTLDDDEWMTFARNTFRDDNGYPKRDYDPELRHTLPRIIAADDADIPELWPQFKALKNIPTLVIRGENSDLLTSETVQKMHEVHDNLASITLKNRGHVPFLNEIEAIAAIDKLITQVDRLE